VDILVTLFVELANGTSFMTAELTIWIANAWKALESNVDWMAWNSFLALIPLALSVWLFGRPRSRTALWWIILLLFGTFLPKAPLLLTHAVRFMRDNRTNYIVWAITIVLIALDVWLLRSPRSRSLFWWFGFLVFIAFLPNAPYVLTDIIHLIEDIRANNSVWKITLVLIPQYLLFILLGLECYVLSLINLGEYLKRQGWGRYVLWVELSLHALSAIGIYLGRFLRFNSWDIITQLDQLANSVVDDLVGKFPVLVMGVTFMVITSLYWIMKQVSLGIILRRKQAIAHHSLASGSDTSTVL
jgi:uncharacterized membrane protein